MQNVWVPFANRNTQLKPYYNINYNGTDFRNILQSLIYKIITSVSPLQKLPIILYLSSAGITWFKDHMHTWESTNLTFTSYCNCIKVKTRHNVLFRRSLFPILWATTSTRVQSCFTRQKHWATTLWNSWSLSSYFFHALFAWHVVFFKYYFRYV